MPKNRQRGGGAPKPQTREFKPKDYAKSGDKVANLGEGDSTLHLNWLPDGDACFNALLSETKWNEMRHHSKPVPRLISIQGTRLEDGTEPMYRHPADEQPALEPFSPIVAELAQRASELLKCTFNHALVQLYRGGEDHINEHADKTLDIVPGTPIVGVSLGASRLLMLRSKAKLKAGTGPELVQKITLPHNSLYALGLDTNRTFTHQISQDTRAPGQRRTDEIAFDSQRISITLRCVGTFIYPDEQGGRLYGQGARLKTRRELEQAVTSGDSGAGRVTQSQEEASRMLRAFHEENKDPGFLWHEHYGDGFDCINFNVLNN